MVFHVKPSVAEGTATPYIASIPGFVEAGQPVYVLPQRYAPGTIFAGFGHGFLPISSVTNVDYTITDIEGPGNFATWQAGDDGSPLINWNPAGGLTTFSNPAYHEHLSWGFTAPGEYKLSVAAVVTHNGQALAPASGTYTFYVGEELPAAPDPDPDPDPDPQPETTLSVTGVAGHYHAGGVANLTAVQEPATSADHYHWFTRADSNAEWQAVSGALTDSYGFVVRAADDGVQVQARLYDDAHGEIAVSEPVTIVVDDHGNSPIEAQNITATLPVTEGALVVSVPEENRDVTLSDFALNAQADRFVTSGAMGAIHVTDTRTGNPGWTLNGRVRTFTTVDGDTLPGANLGWAPEVLSATPSQQVTAGPAVAPTLSGGPGIQGWSALGSAPAGAGIGQAQLGGQLTLEAPLDLVPGTYRGLLILTAI